MGRHNKPLKKLTEVQISTFKKDLLPYQTFLKGFAINLCKNPTQAEDLVSETFFKALCNISSYKAGTSGKAWLSCIMRNSFINSVNFCKHSSKLTDMHDMQSFAYAQTIAYDTPCIDNKIDLDGRIKDIRKYIDKMPPMYIQALTMIYFKGYSLKEAAAILNITLQAMKSRAHNGRLLLKKLIFKNEQNNSKEIFHYSEKGR